MKRRKRDILTAALLLTVPVIVAIVAGTTSSGKGTVSAASDKKAVDTLLQLADAASADVAAPKGAPLGDTGAAPQGAPLGDTGAAAPPTPSTDPNAPAPGQTRVIPKNSLDLVKEMEKTTGDPMDFDKTSDGRWLKATFAALGGFKYEVPDPDEIRKSPTPNKPVKDQIPDKIKKLDGQPTLLVGFMVPIEITREGKVKSFALTQNQTFCCFGVPPAMNEWVMVTMDEGVTADYIMDLPVAAYGLMAVGEEIEDGYVLSMYRMASSEVITAHELLKRTKKPA